MRLQFFPASNTLKQSDRGKESKERSTTAAVSTIQSESDNFKNIEEEEENKESHENDEDGDKEEEEMVVDLELPPGRYSFQTYDYERFVRLRKQLQAQEQNQNPGTEPLEQNRPLQQRNNSQLQGILKKQSAYSSSDSNTVDYNNNSINSHTISSSRSARRQLQKHPPSSFISYVASFTTSMLGWTSTASSNNSDEEANIDYDGTGRSHCSEGTTTVSNRTVAKLPRSLLSRFAGDDGFDDSSIEINRNGSNSSFGTAPKNHQDLIDNVYQLQIQLHQKQKAYKKAKKSRQMEDKRLIKLAQQLQTVDVDHMDVQQSIAELEATNEELETSLANNQNITNASSRRPQEQPRSGRYQEDQQRKLKTMNDEYELLVSRQHDEFERLRRKEQSTIKNLKQRLLHETLELKRLVQLSNIKENTVDHQ